MSPKAVSWLSRQTNIPATHIQEVLMFYTLFNKKPVGEISYSGVLQCILLPSGSRELTQKICEAFQVKEGEVSADGNWTVSRVECLGACELAPVMQVGNQYLGKLKGERAVHVLRGLVTKNS